MASERSASVPDVPAARTIDPEVFPAPFSLDGWLEAHKSDLRPPVGNKMIFGGGASTMWQVMAVGGPNSRTDYHVEDGEEWFYQLKGDLVLKTVENGAFRDVLVREGECFLLPARLPHSPQRSDGSVGLVVERRRRPHEKDRLRWYCPGCGGVTHEASFHCLDLGSQLKPRIEAYYASEEARTCAACGTVDAKPEAGAGPRDNDGRPAARVEGDLAARDRATHPDPFPFLGWIADNEESLRPPVGNKLMAGAGAAFKVMVVGGPNRRTDYHTNETEEWFYQLRGNMTLKVVDGDGNFRDVPIREGECFLLPAGVPHSPQRPEAGSVGLVIEHEREPHHRDSLRWYCRAPSGCRALVHYEPFRCVDLGTQLGPIIRNYYADERLRKCPECGAVDDAPE